jgi:hypothetical protein
MPRKKDDLDEAERSAVATWIREHLRAARYPLAPNLGPLKSAYAKLAPNDGPPPTPRLKAAPIGLAPTRRR